MTQLQRIGILTSGGDAPGMNASIRAVVRAALTHGVETWGITSGFKGMTGGEGAILHSWSVAGILRQGGTVIGAGRFPDFLRPEVQQVAIARMWELCIRGVVVVGGDGSLRGALALHQLGYPVVGIPCSIDNDVPGTDLCIGSDTAINTALEAIDRIKDTASSLQRVMVVEVMGNHCGYLAQAVALAAGAEMVITPASNVTVSQIFERMCLEWRKGKKYFIIVLAEGARWNASQLRHLIDRTDNAYEARHTVLGYIMRGGSPTALDRILATRLGIAAANALLDGVGGVMTSWSHGKVALSPLDQACTETGTLQEDLRELMEITTL